MDCKYAQQSIGQVTEKVRGKIESGEIARPGLGEEGERRAGRLPPTGQRVKRRVDDEQGIDGKKETRQCWLARSCGMNDPMTMPKTEHASPTSGGGTVASPAIASAIPQAPRPNTTAKSAPTPLARFQ